MSCSCESNCADSCRNCGGYHGCEYDCFAEQDGYDEPDHYETPAEEDARAAAIRRNIDPDRGGLLIHHAVNEGAATPYVWGNSGPQYPRSNIAFHSDYSNKHTDLRGKVLNMALTTIRGDFEPADEVTDLTDAERELDRARRRVDVLSKLASLGDDSVICWTRTFSDEGPTYSYVALKAGGYWYTTEQGAQKRSARTLADQLIYADEGSLLFASEWSPLVD